ncbi:MAG: amino acid ABC transporter ATP-binding protein [Lachnospirales bacterium]
MIKLENIKKNYGKLEVLKDVSLDVEIGDIMCIIGPSGSGKSTLLRCIKGLEEKNSGKIFYDGEEISHDRLISDEFGAKMGFVFQSFNLFPHLSILENLTLGPIKVLGKSETDAKELALEYLDKVGLLGKENSYPKQLSGGQQQRVAIARSLCMQPEFILFDEPTSALDPEVIKEVLEVIKSLKALNISMIIVTHELGFAREVSNKVVFMADGYIVEEGSPEEVLQNPKQERTKQFISQVL